MRSSFFQPSCKLAHRDATRFAKFDRFRKIDAALTKLGLGDKCLRLVELFCKRRLA